jgi:pyruvate formate lyase activating enzyme
MNVSEIMEIIEKERVFMEQSGGGVTFSGGEPLLQSEFLLEALQECKRRGIHRAVDTAGHVNTAVLLEVAKETDLFLFDLKMMSSELHQQWTGVSNTLIHENLRHLSASGVEIIIRIPVIGGVNDDSENIDATIEFLRTFTNPVKEVHLLPYHAIAQHKFAKLERAEEFDLFDEPDGDVMQGIVERFEATGVKVQVGG